MIHYIRNYYLTTREKLWISLFFVFCWSFFSFHLALPWADELNEIYHPIWTWCIISGVALIPGFFNIFLTCALLLDKRPKYQDKDHYDDLSNISILIAAYNEQDAIIDTLESIARQDYPEHVEVLICDDGSTDDTVILCKEWIAAKLYKPNFSFKILRAEKNQGKSAALNRGLGQASYDIIITVDADSCLFRDGLINIVSNLEHGPGNTAAVAGSVLVRNSRKNWLTKLQEWEYFHAISVVKKTQSLFQGTLVAQGAFSAYRKDSLEELGGWPHVVGEDIVLTWGLREKGYRVGHAENAICFTNVPEKYKVFWNQRRRWARGLIEAFKQYPKVIWHIKTNSIFIWLNLMFPFLDFMFLFGFIPGLFLAAFFQYYGIVNIITLSLIPAALALNYVIYRVQSKVFDDMGLMVRKNILGFSLYILCCQLLIVTACLRGYLDEFLSLKKSWGTKSIPIKKKKGIKMKRIISNLSYLMIICSFVLAIVLVPLIAKADKLETSYDYIWDNSNFDAHLTNSILKTKYFDLHHSYYDARQDDLSYSYNTGLITTSFAGNNWSAVLGPGIISTSTGSNNPSYSFIGDYQPTDKSNLNLSSDRTPVMAGGSQINGLADFYSDNVSMSGDYELTKQFSSSLGVITQQISDGNSRYGFFSKFHYTINDNFGIQMRNRLMWGDYSPLYFSYKEMERHWLLLTYNRPLFNEKIGLKLAVGPGITKINNRTEGSWMIESKLYGRLSKDVILDVHANCMSSVYNYDYCSVGSKVSISF